MADLCCFRPFWASLRGSALLAGRPDCACRFTLAVGLFRACRCACGWQRILTRPQSVWLSDASCRMLFWHCAQCIDGIIRVAEINESAAVAFWEITKVHTWMLCCSSGKVLLARLLEAAQVAKSLPGPHHFSRPCAGFPFCRHGGKLPPASVLEAAEAAGAGPTELAALVAAWPLAGDKFPAGATGILEGYTQRLSAEVCLSKADWGSPFGAQEPGFEREKR